jgi:hypothetical protein
MSKDPETREQEVLLERLLRSQPQADRMVQRLVERTGEGRVMDAFARIERGRCAACNLAVASARLQQAKRGAFINCASCSRFLYVESH